MTIAADPTGPSTSPGVPSETAREIRELKRKNAELERTIEILKEATAFSARECDPQRRFCQFIDAQKSRFGVVPICRALSAHGVLIASRTYWRTARDRCRGGLCGTPP